MFVLKSSSEEAPISQAVVTLLILIMLKAHDSSTLYQLTSLVPLVPKVLEHGSPAHGLLRGRRVGPQPHPDRAPPRGLGSPQLIGRPQGDDGAEGPVEVFAVRVDPAHEGEGAPEDVGGYGGLENM